MKFNIRTMWNRLWGRNGLPDPVPHEKPADEKPAPVPFPGNIRTIPQPEPPDWAKSFKLPDVAPGVMPSDGMAMDYSPFNPGYHTAISQILPFAGMSFLGYPALAILSQRPLIRSAVTITAEEMTRKWIKIADSDEDDDNPKIEQLMLAQEKFNLAALFRDAMEKTGFMGGCMLFIDTGASDAELAMPLILDPAKIGKGKLKAFRVVEPMYVFPAPYNADNPLSERFYAPDKWYVMGKTVHASRLLRFVQNEVPTVIKPVYNFFGISTAQMMVDYEEKFDIMRNDAGEIVTNFRTSVLKTNLQGIMADGDDCGPTITQRASLFVATRNNKGLFVLDKASEDMSEMTTTVTGLKELVQQALEFNCVVARMPAVKFLGISPSGFNSDDGADMNNWHETVRSLQEKIFTPNLEIALKAIQLSEFGGIDETLSFQYVPLKESTPEQLAAENKNKADTDAVLVTNGILNPEEARKRLARDPTSGYDGLDVSDVPEPEPDPADEGADDGSTPPQE